MSFIQYLSAFLTPIIAIIATIILILQYYLQKLKWRLDLYDKRYPVYLATQEFITRIVSTAKITNAQIFEFLRKSKDKEFLFGEDIQKYLKVVYEKACDLESIILELKNTSRGAERNKLVEKEGDLLRWFTDQINICKNEFIKYLAINKK